MEKEVQPTPPGRREDSDAEGVRSSSSQQHLARSTVSGWSSLPSKMTTPADADRPNLHECTLGRVWETMPRIPIVERGNSFRVDVHVCRHTLEQHNAAPMFTENTKDNHKREGLYLITHLVSSVEYTAGK